MRFTKTLVVLFAAVALATPVQDVSSPEDGVFNMLEKRASCSGNRHNYEVCQGNLVAQMNSRHNCYRANGRCCARNKNRDYGINVSNGAQKGEDCGYCFTGKCKVERH